MDTTLPAPRTFPRVRPLHVILVLGVFLLSAAVGYYGYTRLAVQPAPAASGQPATVQRGTVTSTVTTSGSVVSTRTARLGFQAGGRVKDVLVKLGDRVEAGQPLAVLDTAPLELRLETARSNLRTAQLRLEQLKAGASPEDLAAAEAAYRAAQARLNDLQSGPTGADLQTAQAGVASAQANLEAAQAKLAALEAGPTPSELEAARAAVVAAEASLAAAQKSLADLRARPKPEDVRNAELALEAARNSLWSAQTSRDGTCGNKSAPEYQCQAANASVAAAETNVTKAQVALEQAKQPARPEELRAAEEAVRSAEAQLASARQREQELRAGPSAADLVAARTAVETAEANLRSAQAKLDQLWAVRTSDLASAQSALASAAATLAAKTSPPKDTDLALAVEAVTAAEIAVKQAELDLEAATLRAPFAGVVSQVSVNVGEQVGSSAAITVVDPQAVRVDVNVDEIDVAKLRVGQPAQVTFDALPGRQFPGRVAAVAPAGALSQGVVTYPVAIAIDPADATLPAGMTASVSIVVAQQENVLVVPARAVRRQGRQQYVEVLMGDRTERRTVTTGASNDQVVEITSGLAEGEVVLIPATTTVQPNLQGSPFGGPQPGGPVFIQKPGGR